MEKRLLAILRCPVTRKGLSVLKKDKLEKVNAAIASGDVTTLEGVKVEEPLVAALITDDGKRLYPINDGIPVLLESESIHVEPLI
ncbi:MAG: Trm112 family protein [Woeseiaceae bacterium]|jgi:uncharacterized protein